MIPVRINFFVAGSCAHPEAMVLRHGRWKNTEFPSLFALISHPTAGAILYDTGYSQRFFEETRSFPSRLYAMTTPVTFQATDSAVEQLRSAGILPEDVRYIIISHFHADHIGGLHDFPQAQFICFRSAYTAVKNRRGFRALQSGFLPGLIPADFDQRIVDLEDRAATALPTQYVPFDRGYDVFGDGMLLAVELPGHATGQLGLFLRDVDQQHYFLIADACWLSRAYQELIQPHPLANLIFSDRKAYADTLSKLYQLHQLNPILKIVPTHCAQTWSELPKHSYQP